MQDKAIVQIGKLALEAMGAKEPYQLFIQNMFPEKQNYKMIVAVFELRTLNEQLVCSFRNIDPQNVSNQNFQKYAYRKGSARGGDITFTTKFGDIEKKFRTLVEQQLRALISRSSSFDAIELEIFNAVYSFLLQEDDYAHVKKELSSYYESLSKEDKMSTGLSVMFDINGEEKYLSDFLIIQQLLSANGTVEKSEKYNVRSQGLDQICSICLQKKVIVHGFGSPFKYATVDKPGLVSGFFRQENNWKNYPICTDCSLELELGRSYITNNLSGYFYGKAYYIIPKTLLSNDFKSLKKAVTRLKEIYSNLNNDGQKIQTKEDSLQKMIAQEEDYFNVNLLFFEENPTTKAIRIKLMLEEIIPSRFRRLFVDLPKIVNQHKLYKDAITIKKVKYDLVFSFGILKTFFEDDFYSLIQKVFMLQEISTDALYSKFIKVIRSNYNRMQTSDGYVENTHLTIRKAHLTLSYFQQLGLINHNSNYKLMDTIEQSERKSAFDIEKLKKFLVENRGFLDTDYKTGIFSIGILVRLLLNIQQVNLGNTPFEKKLKGYNLSSELLKTVYMEALNKISQYQGFYAYSNLREFIDYYFILNTHKINKVSNNELSFYFVSGLEFGNQFKTTEVKEELSTSLSI